MTSSRPDGWNLTEMLDAMDREELTALYVIGENPAQSDADTHHVEKVLEGLDHLVVQEIFLTKTARAGARRASRPRRPGARARAR